MWCWSTRSRLRAPASATFRSATVRGGLPTRQISVAIPAGVRGARPQPKPGWTLEVQRDTLAQPTTRHGRTITEDVVRITWTAKTKDDDLPHAHYDEFALGGQLPDRDGATNGRQPGSWKKAAPTGLEAPKPGQKLQDLKAPAALLEIPPGAGTSVIITELPRSQP